MHGQYGDIFNQLELRAFARQGERRSPPAADDEVAAPTAQPRLEPAALLRAVGRRLRAVAVRHA